VIAKAKPTSGPLPDVQNLPDERGVAIDQVGVTDLKFPITVLDRRAERQHTIASLTLSVGLPHHFKGTHMSRFVEVLNGHRGEFTMRTLPEMLAELRARLHAESARVALTFPYFLERTAPVSGATALMDYECTFVGQARERRAGGDDFAVTVRVPVASLCPCSKEISDYGAHNQRGSVEIEVRTVHDAAGHPALVWIEELVEVAERSASAPVYPLLKRPDERHVTMQAYDNPVFVEDLARNVAVALRRDERVASFRVRVVNQESIHNHNAFAEVSWSREAAPSLE
jgi:GTP cyclohydrolase I